MDKWHGLQIAILTLVLSLGSCRTDVPTQAQDGADFQKVCAQVPGCSAPRIAAPDTIEPVWRVEVIREASGKVRIGRVQPLDVPEGDGVPVGPLAGSHLLVGLDGEGKPVDGQLIRFPGVLRVEFTAGRLTPEDVPHEIDLSAREIDTSGYVRALPSIERLAVLGESGVVLATAPVPKSPNLLRSVVIPWLSDLAAPPSDFGRGTLLFAFQGDDSSTVSPSHWSVRPAYCSHVVFLEEDRRNLTRGLADNLEENFNVKVDIRLVSPGPGQLAVVQGALGLMTPLLCQSVSQIGFFVIEPYEAVKGAVNMAGTGDAILLNASYFKEESLVAGDSSQDLRRELLKTVLHEAGHSAEALLNAQGEPLGAFGVWNPTARLLASSTIDQVRLRKGLRVEWERVHESFRDAGWAADYPSSRAEARRRNSWSALQTSEAGFMSSYGAYHSKEDISEFVGWTYMRGAYPRSDLGSGGSQDSACQEMSRHTQKDLPSRLSAVYTKVLFLQDLGLVSPEDAGVCTGPTLGLPVFSPGFHFWQDGKELRSFVNDLRAAIGTTPGGRFVFEMEAGGEATFGDGTYPGTLKLRLDLNSRDGSIDAVSWPRGVYELGLLGNNNLRLRLEGAPAGDFDVKDGFVVVAEASNRRIVGSIFITVAMRLGAPLPVPQTWNPPLVIRFLMER